MKISRKEFLASALAVTGFSINAVCGCPDNVEKPVLIKPDLGDPEKMKICIFSKHLQWMNYDDMSSAAAEMGFDGIDLTVRSNGHVLPDRVEDDLPRAAAAAKRAGVKICLLSTEIEDSTNLLTERILKTAASLEIRNYRTAGLSYQQDADIPGNLERIRSKFEGLAMINKHYDLRCDYLNHSGEGFGSSIWDLWLTLKDIDSKLIGSQFDIKHATIAGAYSWPLDLKVINAYVRTSVVRDFHWEKVKDQWTIKPVPLGEGMVDFKKYFSLVKQYKIAGPMILMCDYPLGGAENGAKKLTIPGQQVLAAIKKDMESLKTLLKEAGL